ncbi:hypothetical protein RB601_003925 [Gaeumannomyces tritici]
MPPGATSSGNGQNGAKGKPTPRMLPPGMTAEQFQQLATRLQDAVGGDNFQVLSPPTKLDDGDYVNVDCQTHDMHFLYDRDDFIGSCLVRPRSVADVQAVARACADLEAPLWTFSKGHNLGIGGWCELRWLSHWMPNCSFLSFSPISKASGESAKAQYGLAKRRFKEARLDYMGILSVGLREMHNVICVVFDRENVDMRRRAQWLVRTMIKDCADNGWGEFRTHTSLMGQVAMTYDFDDNALMRLNEIIKNALDSKGILAPGKSGIWPKNYDKSKVMLGQGYVK